MIKRMVMAATMWVAGCGGDDRVDTAPEAPKGCAQDELVGDDGSCLAPGISPELCAEGFEGDGAAGCRPILPVGPCTGGTKATLGQASCMPIAPCGTGRWGDAQVAPTVKFVDRSYTLLDADGTPARPWPTITAAVSAASAGDTIAIAEGVYEEDLLIGKPLHLVGRCPESVEIRGTGVAPSTVRFRVGSDGSSLRAIAVTGVHGGVSVIEAHGIALEELWIHDTGRNALLVGVPASATLARSLIERIPGIAVIAVGAELTIEDSVVRETTPSVELGPGLGISAVRSSETNTPAKVTLRHALLEAHPASALQLFCADGAVDASVVRENAKAALPGTSAVGAVDCGEGLPTSLVMERSVVTYNGGTSVMVSGANTRIDTTVVSHTAYSDVYSGGRGIIAFASQFGAQGNFVLTRSLIEQNTLAGVTFAGTLGSIEQVIVRDTQPGAGTGVGHGLALMNGQFGAHSTTIVRGSRIQRSHGAGIVMFGADANIERIVIDDTRATLPISAGFGRGIVAAFDPDHALPAQLELRDSVVSNSAGFGIDVTSSFANISGCRIANTSAAIDDPVGDGLLVVTSGQYENVEVPRARAILSATVVENNARAGIANFGGDVGFGDSTFACNAVALNGETDYAIEANHGTFTFEDRGGNRCGCGETTGACEPVTQLLPLPESAPAPSQF